MEIAWAAKEQYVPFFWIKTLVCLYKQQGKSQYPVVGSLAARICASFVCYLLSEHEIVIMRESVVGHVQSVDRSLQIFSRERSNSR